MATADTMEMGQERAEQSDEQRSQSRPQQADGAINVNSHERLLSAGAGLLLTLYGLKRMRLGSIVLAAGGVMLLKRAMTGHCDLYAALGLNSVQGDGAAPEEYFERGIHVEESFTINKPAADLYNFWHRFEISPSSCATSSRCRRWTASARTGSRAARWA